jgi:hypothetical protein
MWWGGRIGKPACFQMLAPPNRTIRAVACALRLAPSTKAKRLRCSHFSDSNAGQASLKLLALAVIIELAGEDMSLDSPEAAFAPRR